MGLAGLTFSGGYKRRPSVVTGRRGDVNSAGTSSNNKISNVTNLAACFLDRFSVDLQNWSRYGGSVVGSCPETTDRTAEGLSARWMLYNSSHLEWRLVREARIGWLCFESLVSENVHS